MEMFSFFRKNRKNDDFENQQDDSLKAYIPRHERANTYKEAKITFPSGYSCRGIVVDMSEGGVRMRFQNNEHLPDYVDLNIPSLNIHTRVRVAWRDTIDYGLEFCEPVRLPS